MHNPNITYRIFKNKYLQIFVELPKLASDGKAVGAEGFLRAVRDIGKTYITQSSGY